MTIKLENTYRPKPTRSAAPERTAARATSPRPSPKAAPKDSPTNAVFYAVLRLCEREGLEVLPRRCPEGARVNLAEGVIHLDPGLSDRAQLLQLSRALGRFYFPQGPDQAQQADLWANQFLANALAGRLDPVEEAVRSTPESTRDFEPVAPARGGDLFQALVSELKPDLPEAVGAAMALLKGLDPGGAWAVGQLVDYLEDLNAEETLRGLARDVSLPISLVRGLTPEDERRIEAGDSATIRRTYHAAIADTLGVYLDLLARHRSHQVRNLRLQARMEVATREELRALVDAYLALAGS